jgi:transaldolase
MTYQSFKEKFQGKRWDFLADKGARLQRVLYGSTSTKNPNYPDVMYVEGLIGPNTVNTIPPKTL